MVVGRTGFEPATTRLKAECSCALRGRQSPADGSGLSYRPLDVWTPRPGFEPGSQPRQGCMIGHYTTRAHVVAQSALYLVVVRSRTVMRASWVRHRLLALNLCCWGEPWFVYKCCGRRELYLLPLSREPVVFIICVAMGVKKRIPPPRLPDHQRDAGVVSNREPLGSGWWPVMPARACGESRPPLQPSALPLS